MLFLSLGLGMLVAGPESPPEQVCLVASVAAMSVALIPRREAGVFVLLGFFCLGLIRSDSVVSTPPGLDSEVLWEIELIRSKWDAPTQLYRLRAAWELGPHGGSPQLLWVGRFDVLGVGLGRRHLQVGPGFRALVAGRVRPARGAFKREFLLLHPARGVHVALPTKRAVRWKPWLRLRIRDLQGHFSRSIDLHTPAELNGLFRALVLGTRSGIDDQKRESFQRTGTAHLLAISGLHVGLLAGLVHSVVRRFVRSMSWFLRPEWAEAGLLEPVPGLCAVAVATCYVVVAGCPTSGLRALAMLALFFALRASGRRFSSWNVLGGAGLGVVLFDPAALRSPALHLSLVSVGSLLLLPRSLGAPGGFLARALQVLGLMFLASFATGLAVAPICAFLWGRVPLAGLWLNAPVLLLLGWGTVPPLLLACFLSLFSQELSRPFFAVASMAASFGLDVVEWSASSFLSPMLYWQPTGGTVVTIYGAVAVALILIHARNRSRSGEGSLNATGSTATVGERAGRSRLESRS